MFLKSRKLKILEDKNCNPFFKTPEKKSGRFITSKSNKHLHGLGLKNVSKIVKKYQGSLDIAVQNDICSS